MGGHHTPARHSRWRAVAAGAAVAALSASLAACGGGSGSADSSEADSTYPVEVVTAKFPTAQRLGETTQLRLGVRNTGEKKMPVMTVTVTLAGKEGRNAGLPFAIRDPQPGLAQADRPVWVLSGRYPRLAGSSDPAGAETSSRKTFEFGPLKPGDTTEAIWQLNAVRTGSYEVLYEIGAGLGGNSKAETAAGTEAGGSFAVRITEEPPDTVVTDSGEVVPAPEDPTEANR